MGNGCSSSTLTRHPGPAWLAAPWRPRVGSRSTWFRSRRVSSRRAPGRDGYSPRFWQRSCIASDPRASILPIRSGPWPTGQCLFIRRDLLERAGGYVVAARSYCDDISIVRQRAASGAHVGFAVGLFDGRRGWGLVLVAANAALVIVRMLLAAATAHSFARRGLAYWLSPLADAPTVLHVVETMTHPPREWRGEPRPVAAAS